MSLIDGIQSASNKQTKKGTRRTLPTKLGYLFAFSLFLRFALFFVFMLINLWKGVLPSQDGSEEGYHGVSSGVISEKGAYGFH